MTGKISYEHKQNQWQDASKKWGSKSDVVSGVFQSILHWKSQNKQEIR